MKNRTPVICDRCRAEGLSGLGSFSEMKPLLDFKPVPRRPRVDGWTPKRQRAFVAALAETGAVSQAAAAVNMSPEGAYYLRRQPGAEEFSAAWDAALDCGADIVDGNALERSIHGVPVPIFHGGKQVGERRVFNERLTMFLLQHRKPKQYGHARKGNHSADDLDRAEKIREQLGTGLQERQERLILLYFGRIAMERRNRLAGNIIAADFYLRQLTHMEVLLEVGDGVQLLLYLAEGRIAAAPADFDPEPLYATELTERLDAGRREAWAEAGEPDRPVHPGNRHAFPSALAGGPDVEERQARLNEARARAAEAQLMLEEALRDQVYAYTGECPETEEPIAEGSVS